MVVAVVTMVIWRHRDSKRVGDKHFNLINRISFLDVAGRVPRLRLSKVGRMGRGSQA